jgi:hypothetical protein
MDTVLQGIGIGFPTDLETDSSPISS